MRIRSISRSSRSRTVGYEMPYASANSLSEPEARTKRLMKARSSSLSSSIQRGTKPSSINRKRMSTILKSAGSRFGRRWDVESPAMAGEFELIDWIRAQGAGAGASSAKDFILVPPGDDLAVLKWPADELLIVGADQVLDGVHFD